MATQYNTVKIKRSTVAGRVPSSLNPGELAINQTDGLLYWVDENNNMQVTPLFPSPIEGLQGNNLVINGGQDIDQIHNGAAVSIVNGVETYATDQFHIATTNTGSAFSAQQVSPPTPLPSFAFGFKNCLQLIATTPVTTIGANDFVRISTPIEGYHWARTCFGSTTALPVTVGTMMYSTQPGTGTFSIRNSALNRSYNNDFALSGGIWQWVPLIIPGDQIGTWLTNNGVGAHLSWCFACGVTYQGTNKTWSAGNFYGTASTGNFFNVANNVVCMTGVMAFIGAQMIPASHAPMLVPSFDKSLSDCLRYWRSSFPYGTVPVDNAGQFALSAWTTDYGASMPNRAMRVTVPFFPKMLKNPQTTLYNPGPTAAGQWWDGSTGASLNARTFYSTVDGLTIDNTDVALSGATSWSINWAANARM